MNSTQFSQSRRVLVIDDNQAIHRDYHNIFAGLDQGVVDLEAEAAALFGNESGNADRAYFELDSAFQGREGVEKARLAKLDGNPYAMAIVDMRMPPGWDGLKTTQELWKIDPDIQVVICTAYSDYSWSNLLDALGTGDRMIILKKPFDPIEVYQMASMLTEKWWLQMQAMRKLEDLETLVDERTRALQRSNNDLVRKNEEIQYFYHTL